MSNLDIFFIVLVIAYFLKMAYDEGARDERHRESMKRIDAIGKKNNNNEKLIE